jgi:hypothetical protein
MCIQLHYYFLIDNVGLSGIFYKSNNGGLTWNSPVILADTNCAWDMQVDQTTSPTGRVTDVIIIATNRGIQTSSDSGLTFKATYSSGTIKSLAKTSLGYIAYTSVSGGMLLSTDLGQTWAVYGNWATVTSGLVTRATFAVDPSNSTIVYALSSNSDNDQRDIYKSTYENDLNMSISSFYIISSFVFNVYTEMVGALGLVWG